jgi:hypothetical protein
VIIPGATSQVYFPALDGNYSVEVSNQYNCKTMSDPYPVGDSVSVPNFIDRNRLAIYPNPSNGMITIKGFILRGGPTEIRIYNVLGEEVWIKELKIESGFLNEKFDLFHLENGFYYVRISMNNEDGVLKMIVN